MEENGPNISNKQVVKEVRIRSQVNNEDYQFKLDGIIRFLQNGDPVKLIVVLKDKEITHPELAEKLLLRFVQSIENYAKAQLPPVKEERQMHLMFTPKVGK